MTAIRINVGEAQEAANRLDEGVGREGDEALAEQFEGYLQYQWATYWDRIEAEERAVLLASQCPSCVEGASGGLCDEHAVEADDSGEVYA